MLSITRLFRQKWLNSSERSKLAAKNIIISFILKIASILTSLAVVPMTINYIDSEQYGIWLTISSIVGWANFFDLGLANGFKNRFAEAIARKEYTLAKEYVSTTYGFVSLLMTITFFVIYLINNYIDLASILNVTATYRFVLHKVFIILAFIFCMNMIVNIFAKLLEADQRPALAAAIGAIGQIISLVSIYLLSKTTEGSLINLAIYFAGIPLITMLICSILMFNFTRYRKYRPSFSSFKFNLVKNLLNLGLKFFFIYLCLIAIFQLMNIVLSRECGPESVTEYNICYKYFNVLYMAFTIVVMPMWAAFTDAYTKKDFLWMKNVLKKFEQSIIWIIGIILIMFLLSKFAYKFWIGDSVKINNLLSFGTMIYVVTQILGSLYMHFINGIGTIRIQLIIYLIFAGISYPMMTIACHHLGPVGIIIVPSFVYGIQALFGHKQIWLIINQKATGIWTK